MPISRNIKSAQALAKDAKTAAMAAAKTAAKTVATEIALRALINDKHAQLKNVKDEYVEKYFGKFDKPKNIEDIQKIINSVNDEEEAINKLLNFENEIVKMEPQSNEEKKKIFKTLIIDEKAQLENVSLNNIYIDEYFNKFADLKSIGEYPKNKEDIQKIINSVNDKVDPKVKKVEQTIKVEAESKADEKLKQEKKLIDFIISNTKEILEKYAKIPNPEFYETDIDNFRSYLNYGSTLLKDVNEEHTKEYLKRLAVACRNKESPYLPNQSTEEKKKKIQEIINSVNGGIKAVKDARDREEETSKALENGYRIFYELKRLEKANKKKYKDILKYMMKKNKLGYEIFKIEDEAMKKKKVEGITPSTNTVDPLLAERVKFMFNQAIHDEIRKVYKTLTSAEKEIFKAAEFEVAERRKRRSKKNKKKKGSKKPRGAQNGKKQSKRRRPVIQKKSRKKKN